MSAETHPIERMVSAQGCLILDGGLATELELQGFPLADSLWSARLILDAPEAIARVHRDYLAAGADCIISASYQASVPGFMARGLSRLRAEEAIARAVDIALRARDAFWADPENRKGRLKPLVAASVGPYGAYLANGAEFTGEYDLDEGGLLDFHRRRLEILASAGADLLACETIPSVAEARALASLLAESDGVDAWLSFSCRDDEHISDGTPIARCVEVLNGVARIVAVGVNCTPPRHISGLLERIRAATDKRIVVYPNSGERWDAERKRWSGASEPSELADAAAEWHAMGARLLGGCCRTRPRHIERLRRRLCARGRA